MWNITSMFLLGLNNLRCKMPIKNKSITKVPSYDILGNPAVPGRLIASGNNSRGAKVPVLWTFDNANYYVRALSGDPEGNTDTQGVVDIYSGKKNTLLRVPNVILDPFDQFRALGCIEETRNRFPNSCKKLGLLYANFGSNFGDLEPPNSHGFLVDGLLTRPSDRPTITFADPNTFIGGNILIFTLGNSSYVKIEQTPVEYPLGIVNALFTRYNLHDVPGDIFDLVPPQVRPYDPPPWFVDEYKIIPPDRADKDADLEILLAHKERYNKLKIIVVIGPDQGPIMDDVPDPASYVGLIDAYGSEFEVLGADPTAFFIVPIGKSVETLLLERAQADAASAPEGLIEVFQLSEGVEAQRNAYMQKVINFFNLTD